MEQDIDNNYIIKVKDYMDLPKPKLKQGFRSNIVVNYGEFLPIILIDSGI